MRLTRPSSSFLAAVVLALLAAPPAAADDLWRHVDPAFAANAYWFDGTAEINLYDATLVVYGQPRQADEVAHIIVTEDHLAEALVKADDPNRSGLVPMLKFNYTTEVRTGVYTYRQMLSFFFERATARAAKMTLTHNEWCGNTFKQLVNFRGRSSYDYNTYWEGGGDGRFEVDFPPDLVIYDSLPVQLRAVRFAEGIEADLRLLPRQLTSRASEPRFTEAKLRVGSRGPLEVPAGRFDSFAVELEHQAGVDRLWFEADFPHRMLRWLRADGDRFELRHSEKMPYWRYNRPQDVGALAD